MRMLIAAVLILSMTALAGAESVSSLASVPMSADELSTSSGAGFFGGFVCGVAGAVAVTGLIAAAGIATAGAGVIWTIAISTSVAGHVAGACMLLD